jgi:farnesyl diphosphate synthase
LDQTSPAFEAALGAAAAAVEAALDAALPRGDAPESRLFEAMRYATLGGGKRLRPFLAIESARLFDVPTAYGARAGAAVELVHCYSLVHDDLPAMDDDDLRRGRPTCHIQFDEATAILAGDALLTLAFEVLAQPETHPDSAVRLALVRSLAEASGATGMVGGQMFDLEAEKRQLTLEEIKRLQRMKTGALFSFACGAGPILGGADDKAQAALAAYAADLGLAFQIADDLLDEVGNEVEMGKKVGKDAAAGKATFVSLLGEDGARHEAARLVSRAVSRLDIFGEKGEPLRDLACFIIARRA